MKFIKLLLLLFVGLDLIAIDLNLHNNLKKTDTLKLYESPYWLKLLHYENNISIIEENSFFLSKKGKTNPKDELEKTIKYFFQDKKNICKYPARYKWLNSKLKFDFDNVYCKDLEEYLKPNFKKVSIIFTSERYNSPASVFGHTFLKLETNTIPYAINYAAKVPGDPNLFIYAYNGINGKYKSKFKVLPYKTKDYEYKSEEFRDLFNMELNLTKDQINNIMLYLYEIKDTSNKYYFLSRNCSSQLIKLLDIADSKFELYNKLNKVVLPIETVYLLKEQNLLKSTSIEISKMKHFVLLIDQLNNKEKILLEKIVSNRLSINDFFYNNNLEKNKKEIIILSAIKYFEIESAKGNFDKKHINPLLKLIKLKNKYNMVSNINTRKKIKEIPVSKYKRRVSVSVKQNENNQNQLNFGFRYLYKNQFDLIDNYKKNGSVELFDISIRKIKRKYSLDYLTLINLEAIPVSNYFFKETTNKITLGLKRVYKQKKLYSYFEYGLGYKYKLFDDIQIHFYPKMGVYHHNSYLLLNSFETSIEKDYKYFTSEIKYTYNKFSNLGSQHVYSFNNYFRLNKNINLNFVGEYINDKNNYDSFMLKLNYYF